MINENEITKKTKLVDKQGEVRQSPDRFRSLDKLGPVPLYDFVQRGVEQLSDKEW